MVSTHHHGRHHHPMGGSKSLMLLSSLILVLVGLVEVVHEEDTLHDYVDNNIEEWEYHSRQQQQRLNAVTKDIIEISSYVIEDHRTVGYDDDVTNSTDGHGHLRRLGVWKFLGDYVEKYAIKAFNKRLGGKYFKILAGLTWDKKKNKFYLKSLRWMKIKAERMKQLKMREVVDNNWFLGFFYKWPHWMTGFGSFFYILFLVVVYRFYGLKHVAAFMVLCILLIFIGAFFHLQRLLEDLQYKIKLAKNVGLWSLFIGTNPIDAVKDLARIIGRIF